MKITDSFQQFCVQEMLISRGCPGGCSLWQKVEFLLDLYKDIHIEIFLTMTIQGHQLVPT